MWSTPEKLSLAELASIGSSHRVQTSYLQSGASSVPPAAYSLTLEPQETVLQVALRFKWQLNSQIETLEVYPGD